MKRPTLLLTNDDGIGAPGLHALVDALAPLGDVVVVAPMTERSAVGHAITLADPLRVEAYTCDGFEGFAVNGTPADCVKIACWALLDRKPDLLVSGINLGINAGINILYSGTVSAATEGTFLGVPSFAVSLATFQNPDFGYAASFARKMTVTLLERGLPEGVTLNVNVPALPADQIRGVSVTRQGQAVFEEEFDKRTDPHGRVYYWLTGEKIDKESDPAVDDGAVEAGMVSITPVHYDLTHYDFLDELERWRLVP